MAEPLKNQFGAYVPRRIAVAVSAVHAPFASRAFLAEVLDGYESLDLMARGRRIADVLRRYLPDDYERALRILLKSIEPPLDEPSRSGMASFFYLPHVTFVARHGLGHFAASMRAQHLLTQRFTAEFSIRPFLQRYPAKTLAQLARWARDPSCHVRRLVSEGTRPRLPWAPRLRHFQQDPRPVLRLLELLKDDPELYVRRSVANCLNDIGKDHPALLATTARRWLKGASEQRRWVIRHALRSAIKRGDAGALAALGFGGSTQIAVGKPRLVPRQPMIGKSLRIAFEVSNRGSRRQRVLVDCRIYFVKASGRASPKVFKLKVLDLAPCQCAPLAKTISLADMTTRKHYPGAHRIEVLLNGRAVPLASFQLRASR